MKTNPEALNAIIEALNGTPVETGKTIDALNEISNALGGQTGAEKLPDAIENIAAVASSGGGGGVSDFKVTNITITAGGAGIRFYGASDSATGGVFLVTDGGVINTFSGGARISPSTSGVMLALMRKQPDDRPEVIPEYYASFDYETDGEVVVTGDASAEDGIIQIYGDCTITIS